jgi:prepilin-type N-terminal cleavage/methylation domain-containing protein
MISLDRKAFTLIELLIVVAIIAILAAIAVPNFLEAQVRSKVSRARTDLRTVTTALESYAVDFNKYPPEMRPYIGASAAGRSPVFGFRGTMSHFTTTGRNRTREHDVVMTVSGALTTPVSYLSTVMPDVFKQGRTITGGYASFSFAGNGDPYETGNPFDATYFYHNIKMRVDSGLVGYLDADVRDYGDWRIYSLGPMGQYWGIGTIDPTMGWKYDPTNGTMSSGFILRTQKDTSGENFSRS